MIDEPCKRGDHDNCKGKTWCDCQHVIGTRLVPPPQVLTLEGIETQEAHGEM